MGVLDDVGIVSIFFDADLHNECMTEYFYDIRKYNPCNTRTLYYNEEMNRFLELDKCGNLEVIHNVYRILEPWKISLFKEQGECIFSDRTNSFLVELTSLPF